MAIFVLIFMGNSCTHDPLNVPEKLTSCDSLNISYSKTIVPILSQHCYSCHSSLEHTHGIILDSYGSLRSFAQEGSLYGSVIHNGDYAPMPYNETMLDTCSIIKIHHWVMEGFKDN